jgi:beta-ureidopropionase
MRIALIQYRAGPDRNANVDRAIKAMERAHDAGADLAAFPELAIDRFFPQQKNADARRVAEPIPGPTADRIAEAAAKYRMVTVFNMYEHDEKNDRFFDSSPVFDSDGSLLGVTRMVHITDYACFHEQEYYDPGDNGAPVYETSVGKIGVAICYDRHYPEYMRALGVAGAELVVIPQAGAIDEWPDGLYEAEVRTASFQNGYFTALCNRVGEEEKLTFAGESFVVDPDGIVVANAKKGDEDLMMVDVDLNQCKTSHAGTLFWRDRRPDLYAKWI